MAIKLIANYSKRLGLPGYSSHQFSVSLETELVATDDMACESERIYHLLQTSVDEQIQQVGFVPPVGYGMNDDAQASPPVVQSPQTSFNGGKWACTPKQRELLLKLVEEHQLHKPEIEAHCRELFGLPVTQLNKMQMSHLIDEVMKQCGIRPNVPALPRHGSPSQGGRQ